VARLHRQAFGLPVTWYKVTSINVTFSSLVLVITYVSEKSSSSKKCASPVLKDFRETFWGRIFLQPVLRIEKYVI